MFFIGVFGTSYKEKEIGEVTLDQCPNCSGTPTGLVVTRYSYFHLFFLPIYKWNQEFAVYCPGCRTWFHLDPEVGHQIEQGALKTLNYWQLKNGKTAHEPYRCENCGSEMETGFIYCPRCGAKRSL